MKPQRALPVAALVAGFERPVALLGGAALRAEPLGASLAARRYAGAMNAWIARVSHVGSGSLLGGSASLGERPAAIG